MDLNELISLVPNGEIISLRICTEDDVLKYIITKKSAASPDKRYKLYEAANGKLTFTGKVSASPIELEDGVNF